MGKTSVAGLGGTPAYDYNLSDFRVDMRVEGLALAAAAAGPAAALLPAAGWVDFTAGQAQTTLASAFIRSVNSVTGTRHDSIANLVCNLTAVPMSLDVRLDPGSGLHVLAVRLPALPLLYRAVSRLALFGSAYDSFANTSMNSSISAQTVLDCAGYCGDFGTCAPKSGGCGSSSRIAGGAVCECDCGWTVPSSNSTECILPSGFCTKPQPAGRGSGPGRDNEAGCPSPSPSTASTSLSPSPATGTAAAKRPSPSRRPPPRGRYLH
ncbi:hypothetical protein HYH02_013761 [Chlamydomonas schloesseri]|uniref:Uncharacterized protein n=1 Tax=Chlamydomonas schloesseri TaxID=2026947 RepID=A0A835SY57_9CHLO|nr:hypothetical protein HYH02_013761 [Chlamydomonas schloesseri]|eukprot:KAG2430399.1 hypothetical protein HYH02_013761 [Chlamydomonas schloesseri]